MAHQTVLPKGKSWSTGSATAAGSFPSSSSAARWMKSERLKKLDQDAKTSSTEMTVLEAEIRDLSTTLEKLERFDAKRVERLSELVDEEVDDDDDDGKKENLDTQDGEGLNGGEEHEGTEDGVREKSSERKRSSKREENEEVESLRGEHQAAQSQIQYTKASLDKKRADLEDLKEKHQALTELIAKEEKFVQAVCIDESLHQTEAVQQEMRSLSEDLGRLGRLMEGLKEANADPLKQGLNRPQQKPRMYHPVTQLRSKNRIRGSQNGGGGASELGRSASVGDAPLGTSRIKDLSKIKEPIRSKEPSSRIKEPAEFEERQGGGNRKRQKSSSFELERERMHVERAKLEVEAKEKKRLLDSLTSFSSSQRPHQLSSKGAPPPVRGSSASFRDISSPSSVFEGFGETPPLGPATSGSTGLMSDSSESSCEFSSAKLDPDSFTSAVKRLDFEALDKEDIPSSEAVASSSPLDTASSKPSYAHILTRNVVDDNVDDHVEDNVNDNVDTERDKSGEQLELSSLENGEECMSSSVKGNEEEFQVPEVNSISTTVEGNTFEGSLGTEGISSVSGIEEGMPGPDIVSSEAEGKQGETEVLTSHSAPEEEIQDPVSEVVSFRLGVLESFSEGFGKPVIRATDTEIALEETEISSLQGAAKDEVEESDIPIEEFVTLRAPDGGGEEEQQNSREEEFITPRNKVEEIEVPEEDIEDFEEVELAAETSEERIPKEETGIDDVETTLETKSEVCAYDEVQGEEAIEVGQATAQAPQLQENGFKSSEPGISGLQNPPEVGQSNDGGTSGERSNRRVEAENQMLQLSSQLSLLQKLVEEEVEVHEKSNTDSQYEHTFAEKEQLSRQVSFFADEVCGLRQNIDEIQLILHNEGELSVEHWAKDLHSKCADQSAQLEHLGKQVSMLGKYFKHHLQLSVDLDDKLDKEAEERHKVETQITDLSKTLAITVSTMEKEEEALGEVIQHQKHLLVDQLKEAEKLRHIAEVRVLTLNTQIEQLEMVYDAAKNIQAVTKYQDKAFRYGLQTLMQLFLLALGIITLYSRVAEPLRDSLVPT
ncbi:unnamed protein product [Calypogeia fissa]